MKKQKGKKKTDEVKVFESTYLAAITRNQELVIENNLLSEEITRLRSSVNYHVRLKMYTDHEVKTWDFSELLKTVQFESPALLVTLLRRIHHNYSVLNIQEMTSALNCGGPYVSKWDEGVTNHLYILKLLADNIEAIHPIE
jgi:hypothetical protein